MAGKHLEYISYILAIMTKEYRHLINAKRE